MSGSTSMTLDISSRGHSYLFYALADVPDGAARVETRYPLADDEGEGDAGGVEDGGGDGFEIVHVDALA